MCNKANKILGSWLEKNSPDNLQYDEESDVIRFSIGNVRYNFFTVPEHRLIVLSHSEPIQRSALSDSQKEAICEILENTKFVRPTPRHDMEKLKMKIVCINNPVTIESFMDMAVKDISDAVDIWNKHKVRLSD